MRNHVFQARGVASLRDDLGASARRILDACVSSTLTFWIDDLSIIHGERPADIPSMVESLIMGTYGVGTPIEDIEDDLRAVRSERARSWIAD